MPDSAIELIKLLITDNPQEILETNSLGRHQINYKKIKSLEFFKSINFD